MAETVFGGIRRMERVGVRDIGGVRAIAVGAVKAGLCTGPLSDGMLSFDEAKELVE